MIMMASVGPWKPWASSSQLFIYENKFIFFFLVKIILYSYSVLFEPSFILVRFASNDELNESIYRQAQSTIDELHCLTVFLFLLFSFGQKRGDVDKKKKRSGQLPVEPNRNLLLFSPSPPPWPTFTHRLELPRPVSKTNLKSRLSF